MRSVQPVQPPPSIVSTPLSPLPSCQAHTSTPPPSTPRPSIPGRINISNSHWRGGGESLSEGEMLFSHLITSQLCSCTLRRSSRTQWTFSGRDEYTPSDKMNEWNGAVLVWWWEIGRDKEFHFTSLCAYVYPLIVVPKTWIRSDRPYGRGRRNTGAITIVSGECERSGVGYANFHSSQSITRSMLPQLTTLHQTDLTEARTSILTGSIVVAVIPAVVEVVRHVIVLPLQVVLI